MIQIILYPPLAQGRQIIQRQMAEGEEFSVLQLLAWLRSKTTEFPGMEEFIMTDNSEQHLMILVNDKTADGLKRIQNGDTIKIVPNMVGG